MGPTGAAGMSPHLPPDYRICMTGAYLLAGSGIVSSVWPAAEPVIGAGLLGFVVSCALVAMLRRELRIRRRLAAIQPRPGPIHLDDAAAATSTDHREVA